MGSAPKHPSIATLLDYWLHDSDADTTAAVDEHLMHCDACGRRLDELVALGEGVQAAFRAGAVAAVTSSDFLRRLAAQGLKVREYRVPCNGSVQCTVAPEDDLLVSRLELPPGDLGRVDAWTEWSTEPGVRHRMQDIPFDAQSGEVLYVPRLIEVRQMPAHTMTLTLQSVASGAIREVGRYTFHHRPWGGD